MAGELHDDLREGRADSVFVLRVMGKSSANRGSIGRVYLQIADEIERLRAELAAVAKDRDIYYQMCIEKVEARAQENWDRWDEAANKADDDPYSQAQDPEYVIMVLKQAEGRCLIDATTAHTKVALASVLGMARRTLEKMSVCQAPSDDV